MVGATKKIIPDFSNVVCVSIESDLSQEGNRNQIKKALECVDQGDGVILLTDMFGGTPSNLCLTFLDKGNIDIISGFNLPMLIKLANLRDKMQLHDLAVFIKQYGQKNIVIASEVLEGKVEY